MAKVKAKKPAAKVVEQPTAAQPLDPKRVHELLGIHGPYEPPPAPLSTKGYVTWWDPGCSIQTLAAKKRELLHLPHLIDGRYTKETDSWRWREIDLTPLGLGETFEEQAKKLKKGYEPPTARELVAYLIVHFLATGQRLESPRLRCKDVTESGRRVLVGPFGDYGLEIANVSDLWKSPGIALCSAFTPTVKKK